MLTFIKRQERKQEVSRHLEVIIRVSKNYFSIQGDVLVVGHSGGDYRVSLVAIIGDKKLLNRY